MYRPLRLRKTVKESPYRRRGLAGEYGVGKKFPWRRLGGTKKAQGPLAKKGRWPGLIRYQTDRAGGEGSAQPAAGV